MTKLPSGPNGLLSVKETPLGNVLGVSAWVNAPSPPVASGKITVSILTPFVHVCSLMFSPKEGDRS